MTEDLHDIVSASNETVRIERLVHHIQRIRDGVAEMKDAMREMAAAINRLAVIEERQNQDRAALERAFNAISDVAKKHDHTTARVMEAVCGRWRWRSRCRARPPSGSRRPVMFVAGKAGLF